MKGYVQIDISNDFKSRLFELVNKINEFNRKDKSEVVIFEPTPWWHINDKYHVDIPEELDTYFDVSIYDSAHYCFYKTKKAGILGELYHLIKAGNPVYLGEELAKVYNKLIEEFKLCSKEN